MKKCMILVLAALSFATPALATTPETDATAKLQAALIIKLLPFYNNLGDKSFTIHVVGAPEVAAQLKGAIGKKTGKAQLANVTSSDGLPSGSTDIIYIGSGAPDGIAYAQKNKILSITGNPDFVAKGVTLGIGVENNKPKIFLNLSSSKAEGVDWNPAILRVAQTVS